MCDLWVIYVSSHKNRLPCRQACEVQSVGRCSHKWRLPCRQEWAGSSAAAAAEAPDCHLPSPQAGGQDRASAGGSPGSAQPDCCTVAGYPRLLQPPRSHRCPPAPPPPPPGGPLPFHSMCTPKGKCSNQRSPSVMGCNPKSKSVVSSCPPPPPPSITVTVSRKLFPERKPC